jgi:hypothetical protein
MRLEHFGFEGGSRKTLVILGAGASRGASFIQGNVDVLPPLDLDFFQQISRLNGCVEAEKLIAFVREEYSHELRLSMEKFFSEVDYTHRFHDELSVDRGAKVQRYVRALKHFYIVVARTLAKATADSACEYHGEIAEKLAAGDAILSFNYDCIIDDALKRRGGNRWDPQKDGYGFEPKGAIDSWRSKTKGQPPKSTIKLLKMHGSLNWDIRNEVVYLREDANPPSASGSIIPPSWFKNLTVEPYASIWRQARLAMRSARILIVVGYSVPPTDLFSQSLFKVEAGSKVKREKLDLVVLVNPEREARRRFLDLVRGGLESSTRVLEYDTLADLYSRMTRTGARA